MQAGPTITDPAESSHPRTKTGVFLQAACLQHRYIRSKDLSNIVERPERLRAVNIGLAAATARLETAVLGTSSNQDAAQNFATNSATSADELAHALGQLTIASVGSATATNALGGLVQFVQSNAALDILNSPAVKYVHGDIEGDVYLEALKAWARESQDKTAKGESELPEHLPQGDLYLCPASIDAIQGALGTVCEAVDAVVSSTRSLARDDAWLSSAACTRAFVAIRPPGHHCGEDTPSGFCFVNNVAVGAAHAHLEHKINRVVILDIDLHHGNGTQSIVWQINEETYRKKLEAEAGAPHTGTNLEVYYGSMHDVLSYPCEDGKLELVQAASVSLHGPHGQHIENIHLQAYTSEQHFWDELYPDPYAKLLSKAEDFLDSTGGPGEDVLVFISCGFDACEHEYESMSRHHRNVPTTFYERFARDVRAFAGKYASGQLISVLEGGYSDRALTSGAMAHLVGLADIDERAVDRQWWSTDSLMQLEGATKKKRGGRASLAGPQEPWLERTLEIFSSIDSSQSITPASSRPTVPPSSRVLRERKKPAETAELPPQVMTGKRGPRKSGAADVASAQVKAEDTSNVLATSQASEGTAEQKKLPRVILRIGPRPDSTSEATQYQ